MSAHIAPGQEEDKPAELFDGPGRRLRVARQTKGLELVRIASELHLSSAMIEALERDDYETLPGEVFILGYIRKYARVVGLDAEPLVAAYHQAAPKKTRAWLRPRPTPQASQQVGSGHLIVRLVSIGVLVLLAVLTFLWWQSQRPADETGAAESVSQEDAAPSEMTRPLAGQEAPAAADTDAAATPSASATTDIRTADEPPQPGSSPGPAITEQSAQPAAPPVAPRDTAVADSISEKVSGSDEDATGSSGTEGTGTGAAEAEDSTPATDDDATASTGAREIVMTFEGPCWVDVRDNEREYKLFGEMKKGDRRVLEGKPPYSIILGNAAAVKITIDGTPFDLSAISQGNVARFTLDPNESP